MYNINDIKAINFAKISVPELTGTEKQIAWAKKIRVEAARDLQAYALTRDSIGRPSSLYTIAMKGVEAMIDDVKDSAAISDNEEIKAEIIDRTVKGYIDLDKRMARLREIMAHEDASWWIDHRYNSVNNHLGQEFHRYLDAE